MMMVGIVIGSGIFLTTGIMAESLPSAGLIMLAWLAGGLLTLAGTLIYAELGAAFPEAGGQYVYLREAYGPLPAFLFGWLTFLVYLSGAIAGLSVAFAEYFGTFFPTLSTSNIILQVPIRALDFTFSISAGQLVAVALIFVLSTVNYVGVAFGKFVQNVFTFIKIAAVLLFVGFGLSIGSGVPVDLSLNPTEMSFTQIITGFGVALLAVSWTFDGWNNLNFVAGEIKNPGRNLPIALVLGTSVITGLYLLINLVFFRAMTAEEMAGVTTIAATASSALFGDAASGIFSVAILISIFGALNGSIFVAARVYYAMGRDGLFFQKAATVHPRFKTPSFAIVIQALWASLLALSGTFDQIFVYVIFVAIILWIAAAASVFTLRKKFPDLPRPYKTWGYPWVPAIFIVASLGILVNSVFEYPWQSLTGLGFTIIGIPVYFVWKRRR